MRAPIFVGIGLLIFVSVLASYGQTNVAPSAATVETMGPRPLPSLMVGGKTFENVTLTGFDGKIVAVSHTYGVKDIPVSDLTPEQIDALNRTSEKFKIVLPGTSPVAAAEQTIPATAPSTNGPPAVATTNAVTQMAPQPQPPVENPAALAEAAAKTESMIQDLKAVGRAENESEPEEDVPVRVPGMVRFLIWAVGSIVTLLLIFFLTAGFLRKRARRHPKST